MIPQGEHKLINLYKGCLPPKINEEDQYFDDQLNKVEYNMTSISFSAIKRRHVPLPKL